MQVIMSFGKVIVTSIKPSTEEVGNLPGTDLFCNMVQYPIANKISGILITRINSGTFCFANASFIRERYTFLLVLNFMYYLIIEYVLIQHGMSRSRK